MMLNYFQLNNFNSEVWNGYNYDHYSSTSYEKYSIDDETILKKYQNQDDFLYKSSSYDFHDHINTCIDSPLDLSKDSTLFNGKTLIENIDTAHLLKSENGLDFEENPHGRNQYPTTILTKATNCCRKIKKNYSMNRRISNLISDERSKPRGRCNIFYCNHCPYTTDHKNNLRRHMYGAHITSSNVVCPRCGITFKHEYSLKNHLSYCGKELQFCCASCPYKSRTKYQLQKHALRHVHKKVRKGKVLILPKASTLPPLSISPCNQNSNLPSSEKAVQLIVEEQPKFNLHVTPTVVAWLIPVSLPLLIPLYNQTSHPPLSQKTEQKAVEEQPIFNVEVKPSVSTLFPEPMSPCKPNSDPSLKPKIEQERAEEQPKLKIKECPGCGKLFQYWGLMQRHYKSCFKNRLQCKYCPYKARDSTMLEMHVISAHPNISSEEALIQIASTKDYKSEG